MPYVFIHGLGQTPESWNQVISDMGLTDAIMCPNLPALILNQESTYKNLYAAFCSYCETESDKLDLCGLSLGGILALNYAIDHPEKVNSLTLIGTQYVMPKKLLAIQNAVFHLMPNKMFASMGFSKKDFIQLSKTMADLNFSLELSAVTCPSLIVCGEKDTANKKASAELAKRIPNAQMSLISGCGHEVNQQAPTQLSKVLRNFWENRA